MAASCGVANEGSSPDGDGGLSPRSGQCGKLSISNPLALAVPVGLRPAPSTPSRASEYETRSGGAFLREPAAALCARAAATHASGALCGAEPHQRRVRQGFPCRPPVSWTRTKCFGRHWCATVWTEKPCGGCGGSGSDATVTTACLSMPPHACTELWVQLTDFLNERQL